MGTALVSCVFANDAKEYLVVGTAYVREAVSCLCMVAVTLESKATI